METSIPSSISSPIVPNAVGVGRTVRSHAIIFLFVVFLCPTLLLAKSPGGEDYSDKETIRALLRRVEQLEARVAQLEANRPSVAPQVPPAAPAPSQLPPEEQTANPPEPQPMDMKTKMQIRGFGDVTFHGDDLKGNHTAFSLGQLNLFVTSDVSEKFRFLSELVFEADQQTNVFSVDVERLLLQFSQNDYFNLAVGRYHTDIGFYNTAYHHSAWLQTAVGRPFLFQFEDNGGILPIHNVGASVTGLIPSGPLGLHYVAEVGNGRDWRPGAEAVQNVLDNNNGKAVNFALFARPNTVRGLQVGFSAYHDRFPAAGTRPIAEEIFDAYGVVQRPGFEWLNEALLIRHDVQGFRVFHTPGFYTQIAKSFGQYRPYFRYQYVNASNSEPLFGTVGLQYGPSVGLRYDASEAVALKLQYDRTAFRQQSPVNGLTLQFAFTF